MARKKDSIFNIEIAQIGYQSLLSEGSFNLIAGDAVEASAKALRIAAASKPGTAFSVTAVQFLGYLTEEALPTAREPVEQVLEADSTLPTGDEDDIPF